jgi:hypothetical protein
VKPVAKAVELPAIFIEKMAAFFAICDNDTMLNRWIPDEDWVRQIQDNGENYCSVVNLNMGMSKHCLWQNNQATQQGRTLFYNNKRIRISKTKVTKKKLDSTVF